MNTVFRELSENQKKYFRDVLSPRDGKKECGDTDF